MNELLAHTNIFINLPPKTVEEIATKVQTKIFKKGELVLEKDILNDSLFVIAKGRVEVLMNVRDKEVKMAELGPAEAFGEMSFIDNFITSARVRAMEDTQVGQLRKHDLLDVIRHDPVAASKFWETLCQILIRRYWILLEQTYKIFKEYFKTHEKLWPLKSPPPPAEYGRWRYGGHPFRAATQPHVPAAHLRLHPERADR